MAVDRSSRYARTPTIHVTRPDGTIVELLEARATPEVGGVFHATPRAGDRLDLIAHRYYRDSLRFWRVADASPEMDPFDVVTPGERLLVPPNK